MSTILGKVDTLRDDVSRHYLAYNADRLHLPPGVPQPQQSLVDDARRVPDGGGNPPIQYEDLKTVPRKGPHRVESQFVITQDDDGGTTVRPVPTGLRLKILGGLRWLEARDIRQAPRATLGALANFTPDKGYGARTLGEMKTDGLVFYPSPGLVELTPEGRLLAPEPPEYATMYEAWAAITTGLHREVLTFLESCHPNATSREFMGKHMGKQFEKGYGARVLGEMKTMGIIRYPTPGTLALTEHVMPACDGY